MQASSAHASMQLTSVLQLLSLAHVVHWEPHAPAPLSEEFEQSVQVSPASTVEWPPLSPPALLLLSFPESVPLPGWVPPESPVASGLLPSTVPLSSSSALLALLPPPPPHPVGCPRRTAARMVAKRSTVATLRIPFMFPLSSRAWRTTHRGNDRTGRL